MPQETKSHGVGGGVMEREALPTFQGLVATREDEKALLEALEKAFDYRGDVTLTLVDGSSVVGYIFDRRAGDRLANSKLRLMGAASDEKIEIAYDRIARIEFSGKDTAAGKSFETWLKKYVEKRLAGEKASIESEKLD